MASLARGAYRRGLCGGTTPAVLLCREEEKLKSQTIRFIMSLHEVLMKQLYLKMKMITTVAYFLCMNSIPRILSKSEGNANKGRRRKNAAVRPPRIRAKNLLKFCAF